MVVHSVCVLIMCYTKFSGMHFVNYDRIYSDVFIAGMPLENISEHCLVVYVSEVLFCLELHITVSSFHLLPLHCIVHTQSSVCLHELSGYMHICKIHFLRINFCGNSFSFCS